MRVQLAAVTKRYGAQVVLDQVDLTIGPHARLGVVGPNGVGKSTLLRILAGVEEPDAGSVARAPAWLTAGYLAQERLRRRAGSAARHARAADRRRRGGARARRGVRRRSPTGGAAEERYSAALERFLALGGGDFEARARTVCADLGLSVDLDQSADTLSGGERATGGAGRDPAVPLRPAAARRADERPRPRRARAARAVPRRVRRARSWSCRTTASCSTGR